MMSTGMLNIRVSDWPRVVEIGENKKYPLQPGVCGMVNRLNQVHSMSHLLPTGL